MSIFNRWVPDRKYSILAVGFPTSRHCLGLAVECAIARLSTQTGLISCTEPGINPVQGVKLGQACML